MPIQLLSACSFGVLNYLLGMLGFLKASIFSIARNDTVILYNYYPIYLPATLVLFLRRVPIIVDVEDAPIPHLAGLRAITARLAFPTLSVFASGFFAASQAVKDIYCKRKCIVLHGTVSEKGEHSSFPKRAHRLSVWYGGTIDRDSGLYIFVDAVKALVIRNKDLGVPVDIYITGSGGADELDALCAEIAGVPRLSINRLQDLSVSKYQELMRKMDIGVNLKLPEGIYGRTTFPSKTLEILEHGMLLISTKVSDVPAILSEDQAFFLSQPNGDALAEAIVYISNNIHLANDVRLSGSIAAKRKYEIRAVGMAIKNFVDEIKH